MPVVRRSSGGGRPKELGVGRDLPTPASASVPVMSTLGTVAAAFSAAGGVIHFVEIGNHRDVEIVAVGFVVMGVAQWWFAIRAYTRPSARVLLLGAALHAGIAATWALSRTTGLGFVPGAEEPAPIGVADVVASGFSVGVVGVALVWRALDRETGALVIPAAIARRVTAVVLAGAFLLTVPAMWAPHDHASHAPASNASDPGRGHHHVPAGATGAGEHDVARPEAPTASTVATTDGGLGHPPAFEAPHVHPDGSETAHVHPAPDSDR